MCAVGRRKSKHRGRVLLEDRMDVNFCGDVNCQDSLRRGKGDISLSERLAQDEEYPKHMCTYGSRRGSLPCDLLPIGTLFALSFVAHLGQFGGQFITFVSPHNNVNSLSWNRSVLR